MFKKIVKMMLFVFVVSMFCNVIGMVGYADQNELKFPTIGLPDSIGYEYGEKGQIIKERRYGPDGRAVQDTDYEHGGPHHKFPHDHNWDWNEGDSNPKRKDGVPKPGAKKLPPKQKNKNDKNKKRPKKKWKIRKPAFLQVSKNTKKAVTGATVLGTIVYFIVSEGSRVVFPPRNLIPVL